VLYGLAYVTGRGRRAEAAPVPGPGPKQPLGVST
jgi:hypothetical protein